MTGRAPHFKFEPAFAPPTQPAIGTRAIRPTPNRPATARPAPRADPLRRSIRRPPRAARRKSRTPACPTATRARSRTACRPAANRDQAQRHPRDQRVARDAGPGRQRDAQVGIRERRIVFRQQPDRAPAGRMHAARAASITPCLPPPTMATPPPRAHARSAARPASARQSPRADRSRRPACDAAARALPLRELRQRVARRFRPLIHDVVAVQGLPQCKNAGADRRQHDRQHRRLRNRFARPTASDTSAAAGC